MPVPLIIAHRGASAAAPENTIAAFKAAFESGADGVEFDVRLSVWTVNTPRWIAPGDRAGTVRRHYE